MQEEVAYAWLLGRKLLPRDTDPREADVDRRLPVDNALVDRPDLFPVTAAADGVLDVDEAEELSRRRICVSFREACMLDTLF